MGLLALSMFACVACGETKNGAQDNNTNISKDNDITDENGSDNTVLSMEALENAKETDKEEFSYFSYEGVTYITQYIGDSEIVVIPGEIDGTPVVQVSDTAFRNNEIVKAVKIGKNVKVIGEYVFANCINLEYVIFGDNVESVGEATFIGCALLTEVRLNEGLKIIGESAICETEVPLVIPRSVVQIDAMGVWSPIQVYAGSYAEQYVAEYAAQYSGEDFTYEVIE